MIFELSDFKSDPAAEKNSGMTLYCLGRQAVGRSLLDKLVQAGVKVDGGIFSPSKDNRIQELEIKLNNLIGGYEDE
jgi:hypothetical protein